MKYISNKISNKHIELLLKLIKKLVEQFHSQNPQPKRPSRPPAYTTESEIHKNISYRALELILGLLSFVLSGTTEICEKVLDIREYHAVVADATG